MERGPKLHKEGTERIQRGVGRGRNKGNTRTKPVILGVSRTISAREDRSMSTSKSSTGRIGLWHLVSHIKMTHRNNYFISEGYEAGECSGQCIHPLPSHLNATNHAIIQSLIHSFNPSQVAHGLFSTKITSFNLQVPPPCCIPTQTAPLSILYMDVDNV